MDHPPSHEAIMNDFAVYYVRSNVPESAKFIVEHHLDKIGIGHRGMLKQIAEKGIKSIPQTSENVAMYHSLCSYILSKKIPYRVLSYTDRKKNTDYKFET